MQDVTKPLDLKTVDWFMGPVQALEHPQGFRIDFYTLANEGGSEVVGLSVPHHRPEVASFVVRCLHAGQKLLSMLKSDEPFQPERAEPNPQAVIMGVVFREAEPDTVMAMLTDLDIKFDPQHVRDRLALLRNKKPA